MFPICRNLYPTPSYKTHSNGPYVIILCVYDCLNVYLLLSTKN